MNSVSHNQPTLSQQKLSQQDVALATLAASATTLASISWMAATDADSNIASPMVMTFSFLLKKTRLAETHQDSLQILSKIEDYKNNKQLQQEMKSSYLYLMEDKTRQKG